MNGKSFRRVSKAALAVKKTQLALVGKKLGGPDPLASLALANAARRRATPPPEVLKLMRGWRQEKKSLRTIAYELYRLGVRTGRGSEWYASTARLQLGEGKAQAHASKSADWNN